MLYQQGGLDIQASEQTSLECVAKVSSVTFFSHRRCAHLRGVCFNPKMNQSEQVAAKSLSSVGSINLHRLDTFG